MPDGEYGSHLVRVSSPQERATRTTSFSPRLPSLKLSQTDRSREKFDEWAHLSIRRERKLQDVAPQYALIRQRKANRKIFSLDVLDERVIGIVSARRPLKGFPAHLVDCPQLSSGSVSLPAFRIACDGVSDFLQGSRLRM